MGKQAKENQNTAIQDAKEILNVSNTGMIKILPKGYITSKPIDMTLRTLAGVYSGTVQVCKEESNYGIDKHFTVGSYSQKEDPKSYERVLNESDLNKDKIITRKEAKTLRDRVYSNAEDCLASDLEYYKRMLGCEKNE